MLSSLLQWQHTAFYAPDQTNIQAVTCKTTWATAGSADPQQASDRGGEGNPSLRCTWPATCNEGQNEQRAGRFATGTWLRLRLQGVKHQRRQFNAGCARNRRGGIRMMHPGIHQVEAGAVSAAQPSEEQREAQPPSKESKWRQA